MEGISLIFAMLNTLITTLFSSFHPVDMHGPTFPGGSNCLFPIEIHITCDFLGGRGGPDLLSPPCNSLHAG